MRDEAIFDTITTLRRVLRERPDAEEFTLQISRPMAEMVLDFAESLDPDMPPRPVMKALGPLVGDIMMNDKLNRMTDLYNKFGPLVVYLAMVVDRAEKRIDRRLRRLDRMEERQHVRPVRG